MLGNSSNPVTQRIEQEEFLKACFTKEEIEQLRNGDKVDNNIEDNTDKKKIDELIKKIEEKLIKEYKKDKDKIEKSDTDDIKPGYLMAINKKFIFFRDGKLNTNVMEAEEALRLLNNIKYIIKQVGVDISESGFGWFIANNITFEIVHRDIISETGKNPVYMDDIYPKRKVKDEYLFSRVSMTTKKKPIASVITEENSKTDNK